jgi:hypothetical protein
VGDYALGLARVNKIGLAPVGSVPDMDVSGCKLL